MASYTHPNVPLPRSFPFCHWPATDGTSTFETTWWLVFVCFGLTEAGGRGNGWKLALPLPSLRETWFSGNNFGCIGDGGALGFLDLKTGLLSGLERGERSWQPANLSGEAEGGEDPVRSEDQIDCTDHTLVSWMDIAADEKSTLLNLRGLCTGLENPLLGALLAGMFNLKFKVSSEFLSWNFSLKAFLRWPQVVPFNRKSLCSWVFGRVWATTLLP